MFCLRVNQMKLVRQLPYTGLSAGPITWPSGEKKINAISWSEKLQYMSTEEQKKGDPFKDMNLRLFLNSISCAFKEIPWGEAKSAPTPLFWSSMGSAGAFWIPPMTTIFFGYSNWLSVCEICWAAITVSFGGGIKKGTTISNFMEPNWYNMVISGVPPLIGFFSLMMLPQIFAYPVLLITMVLTTAHDALNPKLPLWFRSLRIVGLASAAAAMSLMFLFKLFHLGK